MHCVCVGRCALCILSFIWTWMENGIFHHAGSDGTDAAFKNQIKTKDLYLKSGEQNP